jgi:Na+/melibiose symporter-like transporter
MWSAEMIANTFIGPPLGSLLLLVAFSLPFFVDSVSFFAAAALVAAIPGTFRADRPDDHVQAPWRTELAEGFRWLWSNDLLRAMAIILGLMNMASTLSGSVLVLFAQEILHIGPLVFTIMGFGFAAGGALGGIIAPRLSKRFGSGTCLAMTLASGAITSFFIGLSSWWPVVMVMFALGTALGSTWNVITVSLRQTIIPSHLLGRVNSVYRFFAWGMMPIGAAIGGVTVTVVSHLVNREFALRSAFFLDAFIYACLFIAGRSKLTTAKLEAARASVPA